MHDQAHLQALADDLALAAGITAPVVKVATGAEAHTHLAGRRSPATISLGQLFLAVRSEDEVRAVLAHEIAHLVRRDEARLVPLGAAVYAPIALIPVLILLLGWRPAFPWVIGICALHLAGRLGWAHASRRAEYAADRLAAVLLGTPDSLCDTLHAEANREGRVGPVRALWRGHPSFASRAARLSVAVE